MARMTGIPNGNAASPKANGSVGLSAGAYGHGGSAPAPKRPLTHIDDITSVIIDYDRFTPMDKLLATAEESLHQADTYRTFGGRIDMALMSYIRACTILFETVKHNKGWVSLQADNRAQKQRYDHLARQANAAFGMFEKIKADIKADNARTGIQPKAHRHPRAAEPATKAVSAVPKDNKNSVDNDGGAAGMPTPAPFPIPPKAKPKVHPKP